MNDVARGIRGVQGSIAARLERWEARRDRRAAFLAWYALSIDAVRDALERGEFADTAWTVQLVAHLAEYYLITVAPASDDLTLVTPPAWNAAHAAPPGRGRRTQLEWLALGINAHINNDLPQAVAAMMWQRWPVDSVSLAQRRRDVTRLALIGAEAASSASEAMAGTATDAAARMTAAMAERAVVMWSDDAWDNALKLCTAANASWWHAIREEIECTAERRAHLLSCDIPGRGALLLAPSSHLHRLFPAQHPRSECRLSTQAPSWGTPARAASFFDR